MVSYHCILGLHGELSLYIRFAVIKHHVYIHLLDSLFSVETLVLLYILLPRSRFFEIWETSLLPWSRLSEFGRLLSSEKN